MADDDRRVGDPEELLRRSRLMWRACLFLPFVYLGIGLVVEKIWFDSNQNAGFFPMRKETFRRLMIALCTLAVCAQAGLLYVRWGFRAKLREVRLIRSRAASLYWRRTLTLVILCDVVCALGLVAFLISAAWEPFIGFCIFSYLMYAQAFPRARFLNES